jgi:hypothetical protein
MFTSLKTLKQVGSTGVVCSRGLVKELLLRRGLVIGLLLRMGLVIGLLLRRGLVIGLLLRRGLVDPVEDTSSSSSVVSRPLAGGGH